MTTILVVDDNKMLRSVMQRRLSRVGWDVLLATNGAEGVATAKASRPDLILMDMTMPVMDGWTATRELRADPETRHIPIVAFTAQRTAGDSADALAAGCNDQIFKPFEFPDVLAKIRALLENAAPAGDPAS